jgi:hypothetical protein
MDPMVVAAISGALTALATEIAKLSWALASIYKAFL